MSDARGIDELLEVRGLNSAEVMNTPVKTAMKRREEEVRGLERLLERVVFGKKPDGYGVVAGSS